MANEEFKTTVISYNANEQQPVVQQEEKPNIQNILFNVTTKVPHVNETLPTVKIDTTKATTKINLTPLQKLNKNASSFPKFYIKEYKRSWNLVIMWLVITAICLALETWALISIFTTSVNNWVALTLIPGITFCIAFLIIYVNNWINFKNEARAVDFSQGKIPTINVMKLYKRLKTAHINVNWFCGLTYAAGGLAILITYLVGWGIAGFKPEAWGVLDPSYPPFVNSCGAALLISVIVCCIAVGAAFFLHVILLVTNYTRAAKIDNYYSVQIVSDEELRAIKKRKNKRDMIIFLAVVMIIVLIGMMIYKIIKSKKVNNNVTINNV
ncbi:MAG: MSC_0882 family membrane protein [Mycoplasmoidaceae bacterium]